jgi:ectoine hydroxylase
MKLKPKQLEELQEQGCLVFPNCFSEEEVAVLGTQAESIYKTDRQEVWREKSGAPRMAFAAHTYNEAFAIVARHPRLIGPLEQFFGEPVYTTSR